MRFEIRLITVAALLLLLIAASCQPQAIAEGRQSTAAPAARGEP
jgi:hypothetical protein